MANQTVAVFSALADPARLATLDRLRSGPASVSELASDHAMALPSYLKHVRILETAGLIATEKVGRVRICRARPEALADAERWITRLREHWTASLDRLAATLEDE